MPEPDAILQQIEQRRIAIGMSQAEAARRAGFSQRGHWRRYVDPAASGHRRPSIDVLVRMAEAVGATIQVSASPRSAVGTPMKASQT